MKNYIMEENVKIEARKFQMEALNKTMQVIKENKSGIIWAATGSGKTILEKMILQEVGDEKIRFVILDRKDLIFQTEFEFNKTFDNIIVVKTIIELDEILNNINNYKDKIIITSLQKFGFLNRTKKYDIKNALLLIDECHRSHTIKKNSVHNLMVRIFDNPVLIGLTGTPTYESIKVFGRIINVYCFLDAIEDSIVVPFQYKKIEGIQTIDSAISYWEDNCDISYKSIFVTKGVETVESVAESMNQTLNKKGFKALAMTYKTKKQKQLLQAFKEDESYKFLVVDTKCLVGYNVPNMKYIFLDKEIKSLNMFFQSISRTNRSFFSKNKGVILDFMDNKNIFKESIRMYSSLKNFKEYLQKCLEREKNKRKKKTVSVLFEDGVRFVGTVKEITDKFQQFKPSGIYGAMKNRKQYKKTTFIEIKD